MQRLHVHFLPEHLPGDGLAEATVVVLDVLRASTTIIEALAAGAKEVVACREIDHAHRAADDREAVVLAGERGGRPIQGFDLGNSPTEFTAQSVGGRTVVLTTTNGTRALSRCQHAGEVLIGGAVNLTALSAVLRHRDTVHVVCAGTESEVSRDDVLIAGAIAYQLAFRAKLEPELNDAAQLAIAAWKGVKAAAIARGEQLRNRLALELRETAGGRNLLALGYDEDLGIAAHVDRHAIVPRYNPETGVIRLT